MADVADDQTTIGDLYDRLSEADRKKAFFLLFGIVEFYADPDTWFATSVVADPPCGDIVRDYRIVSGGNTHRPGGRARLALHWILKAFERVLT